MKKITFLFAFFLSLLGGTQAWAETLTANFDSGLPEGWSLVGSVTNDDTRNRTGKGIWTSDKSTTENYVITEAVEGTFEFYARAYNKGSESTVVVYEYTGSGFGAQLFTTGSMKTSSTPSWSRYSFTISSGTQLAIVLNYAAIDDVTYTQMEAVNGPALTVKDGSTKLTTGYAYDFGLTTAGTTHTFTLSNPGTESVNLSVSETGGFGASLSATSIVAGGEVTLTLTMPATTGSSKVTITPDGDLDPFVLNVSGTIRDPNKVYLDFSDGSMPDGWTSVKVGSWASDWTVGTGYIGQSNSHSYSTTSYDAAFMSPKLIFEKDEVILFESARYNDNTNASYIKVQYSIDGSSWTDCSDNFTDNVYGKWQWRSATVPTADAKYIRFYGKNTYLRNIYGGELPMEPKLTVTEPSSLNYGAIAEVTSKTFTIANTGRAEMTGISVSSDNAAFTITGAPTSLAAGESKEVTVTLGIGTIGNHNATITISATGVENASFNLTGLVLPTGLSVVDFNDNQLPSNWTNNGWTFSNGEAYLGYNDGSKYMNTPKITVEEGDMFVIKTKTSYNGSYYYVTINGSSDNGTTWTAYTKTLNPGTEYQTYLIDDIPATVNCLQFKGYYGYIDEIQGINYAPVLSVTKDAAAVTTPAAYDFGECGTNATVTYNFANAGAGTINITNVEITGDGVAAYSTNWSTSVATPFDLVITRTYDADRAGAAQDAVVTVTTSEGDFVINVTGTDKAANAPELAVDMASIDFGKLTANDTKTVTVTNNGTGSMDVTIASDDALFTVAPASLTGIGAGESKTFDVTFNFDDVAGSYGVKNANVTVTPSYDAAAAVVITATANAKDPDLWSEYFTTDGVPTGWDASSNWTIADGVATAKWASGTNDYLTTPVLKVESTSDELTFDYQATANYVSIKIQMSKDGAAFADYKTISGLNNGDAGTYTITGLEAGDYQFRFANDDYKLDNFEGFKLNLPDHIMSITTSSIPTSSSYSPTMKIGKSFEATVTVKELRGVAETGVVAKLYMGEDVIGTSVSTDFEANETKEITISCTPSVAAPSGAQMHIEVVYAGGTLATAEETRYVADLNRLTLDETSASESLATGTYDVVTLKRTFVAGWNTVCLPNAIDDIEAFFGTGAKAYNFDSYEGGVLGFAETTSMEASYPYIIYVPAAITDDFILNDFTISNSNYTPGFRYKGTSPNTAYFYGTYAPIAAPNMDGKWGVTDEAKIAKGNASASINGFRGYFTLPAGASARLAFTDEDGTTTVINALELNQNVEGVYNLQGQKVERMQKGLYIVNGRKVVRK